LNPRPAVPLDLYDYPLPEDRIAQFPLERRDHARLMVLRRGRDGWRHARFDALPGLLPAEAVLVVNNTRVAPNRLLGRSAGGARIEALLLAEIGPGRWEALVKRARRLKPGHPISFAQGQIPATAVARTAEGHWLLEFADPATLRERIARHGLAPLPPYIRREDGAADLHARDRAAYQTVYAREEGAVAAPTAGLHFTPEVLAALRQSGRTVLEVTLHVGLGTFAPVKVDDPALHPMHAERFAMPPEAARALTQAKAAGRPVIAVGTTAVRVLETWARAGFPPGLSGETRLFIRPPFEFLAVDGLLTNFHLPRSTLLMLVAAFHGRDLVLTAYGEAVMQEYRFFSYGDCMAILPSGAADTP